MRGASHTQPSAIFFDLDGTILDWQSGMEESWLASCEANCDGSFVPIDMHEAIRTRRTWFWGDPDRARTGRMDLDAASREIVRHAFAEAGLSAIELAHRIADDYRARRAAHIALYPGAIETLATVRARGIRTALLTNGNAMSQRGSVERFALGAILRLHRHRRRVRHRQAGRARLPPRDAVVRLQRGIDVDDRR